MQLLEYLSIGFQFSRVQRYYLSPKINSTWLARHSFDNIVSKMVEIDHDLFDDFDEDETMI